MQYRWWLAAFLICQLVIANWALAQDSQRPRLTGNAGISGIGQYQPYTWGIVRATVENPTDQDQQLMLCHFLDNAAAFQYCGEVWLPPQSRRTVWLPIRPGDIPEGTRGLNMTSLLLGPRDQRLSDQPGTLLVTQNYPVTGMLRGGDEDALISAFVEYKEASTRSGRSMAYLDPAQVPFIHAAWNGLDSMIIAGRGKDLDTAQKLAIRQWLIAGGRIWLMLDQVDQDFAAELLGEDYRLHVVDRVPLSTAAIKRGDREKVDSVDLEQPVDLLRVLPARDVEVLHTVNGWPATMKLAVGRGEVMVTTIGPAAWADQEGSLNEAGREIARWMVQDTVAPPVTAEQFAPFVAEQIGFEVMRPAPVMVTLGSFCGLLLIGGMVLYHRRQLEYLAPIGVVAALIASVVLVVLGKINRDVAPLTIASSQLVQVVPNQQHVVITGLMSIYSPDGGSAESNQLRATKGGIVWTDMPASQGHPLRTIWTDIDKWYWENFELPSGSVINAPFEKSEHLESEVRAVASFGPDGLEIDLKAGPLSNLSSSVVAWAGEVVSPRQPAPTQFVVGEDDRPAPGTYARQGDLSWDVARRRDRIYETMFTSEEFGKPDYPSVPTLFAWAKPMDLGLELPKQADRRDSAVVAIPLSFRRSAPGDQVMVPSMFMDFATVKPRGGGSFSPVYDPKNRDWIKMSNNTNTVLQFTLPEEVLPLKATEVEFELDIDAPGRNVVVQRYEGDRLVPVETFTSPSGTVRVSMPVDHPDVQPDAQGNIPIGLSVTDADAAGDGYGSIWQIHDVRLTVSGLVQPAQKRASAGRSTGELALRLENISGHGE